MPSGMAYAPPWTITAAMRWSIHADALHALVGWAWLVDHTSHTCVGELHLEGWADSGDAAMSEEDKRQQEEVLNQMQAYEERKVIY